MKNTSMKRALSKPKVFNSKNVILKNEKIEKNDKIEKKEEIQVNVKETLQIKDQSPLLYNRKKDILADKELIVKIKKNTRPKFEDDSTPIEVIKEVDYTYINDQKNIENDALKKRIIELEKETCLLKYVKKND